MRNLGLPLLLLILSTQAFAHPLVFGDSDGGERPQTLGECLDRMDLITSVLPGDDGIARFNHLYETTTQNIDRSISDGRFEDAAFMTDFTVKFAGFYFEAVSAYFSANGHPPRAWRVLFESRQRSADLAPVQFAIAGMEAHISRDLPVVLAALFNDDDSYPARASSRHRDYLTVNQVLAETFDQLHDELLDGPLWFRIVGDVGALPWIRMLRDKAWLDGKALWELRNHSLSHDAYLDTLDDETRIEAASNFLIRL